MKSDILDWVILLCVIDLLVIGTYQRNFPWKDEIALWKDCVQKSPQKEKTHHNLGFAYYEREQLIGGLRHFKMQTSIHYPPVHLFSYAERCLAIERECFPSRKR